MTVAFENGVAGVVSGDASLLHAYDEVEMNQAPGRHGAVSQTVEAPSWLRPTLYGVAALCVWAGIFRMVKLNEPPDRDVLLFFLAAAVVVLADTIKKFKFGDLEVERVQRLEERIQELAEVAEVHRARTLPLSVGSERAVAVAETHSVPQVTQSLETRASALAEQIYRSPLVWKTDPVARQRGDSSTNGTRLKAKVSPSKNYEDSFRVAIDLEVASETNLEGDERVALFLHHTFPERVRLLPLENRRASLTLISGGSFTVGALLPNGTFLALDLTKADLEELSNPQRRIFKNT